MSRERTNWKPSGGLERPHIEELPAPRGLRTEDGGVRNGMPEWKPYVRNPKIAAREAEIAAELTAIRARIGLDKTSMCAECGGVYWTDSGHKCGSE